MIEEDVENVDTTKQANNQTNAMKDIFLGICLFAGINLVLLLAGDILGSLFWKITSIFFDRSTDYLNFFYASKFAKIFLINISIFIYFIVKHPRVSVKFDNILQKISNWKTILAFFIISFPLGYYIDPVFTMTPRFDYLYSYSVSTAYMIVSDFYFTGMLRAYAVYELTFQVFFPSVTALFFITFIYHAGTGLISKKMLVPFALIIPTTTLVIDYLENAGLVILIHSYEKLGLKTFYPFASKLTTIVKITSGFATIKGLLWDIQWYIFLVGITIYLLRAIGFTLTKIGIIKTIKKTEYTEKHSDA